MVGRRCHGRDRSDFTVSFPRPPDVHISIITMGNRDLLVRCLETLAPACEGLSWATTVIDNLSCDGSVARVRDQFEWVRLICNTRPLGFSANHNIVLREAMATELARYVLILNDDTELAAGAVRELVAFADAHPRVGAVGPVVCGTDGVVVPSLLAFPTVARESYRALCMATDTCARGESGWLNGSCVLLRTTALHEVGLLDERFFLFFEDSDLGLRLWKRGWGSAVAPSASMLHHGHQTVGRPDPGNPMNRQMIRSRYLFFLKHHGWPRAVALLWLVRAAYALRAAKALATAVMRGDEVERTHGVMLSILARSDPRRPLPHEVASQRAR